MQRFISLFATLLLGAPAALATLGPPTYTLASLEAQVVDKESGEPIAGAAVIGHWVLDAGSGDRIATLRLADAITDEKGMFLFPEVGSIARPLAGVLDRDDPQLIIFKSGYIPLRLSNGAASAPNERRWMVTRKSDWHQRTIALEKRPPDEMEYVSRIRGAFVGLRRPFIETDCIWKRIPNALVILDQEHRREIAAGIGRPATPSLQYLNQMNCK